MSRRLVALLLALPLCACEHEATPPLPAEKIGQQPMPKTSALLPQALPGGGTTVIELNPETPQHLHVLSRPAANLSARERGLFAVGNSFFTQPWVSAPASTAARDGLGPLYNAAACQDCHLRDGRGHPPSGPDDALLAGVVRITRPDGSAHPVYGGQIQPRALPGVAAEARVRLHWQTRVETLPDGSNIKLRWPQLALDQWGYGLPGPLHAGLRVAPPMSGLGLLEAIPETSLSDYARAQAQRWPALSGRLRRVADLENPSTGSAAAGRFGWKAAQASVRQQMLDAFVNDLGITSGLRPQDACTPAQAACRAAPPGDSPELGGHIEQALVLYARHLALPARRDLERPDVRAGAALFEVIGCGGCHRAQWQTGAMPDAPALAQQSIWPYTDLLLHEMGEGLSDGVAEPGVAASEWRTAPLWGLQHALVVGGAKAGYLHDGRARTLSEAILWHGGEAQAARNAWAALDKEQRRQLLRFLASL